MSTNKTPAEAAHDHNHRRSLKAAKAFGTATNHSQRKRALAAAIHFDARNGIVFRPRGKDASTATA